MFMHTHQEILDAFEKGIRENRQVTIDGSELVYLFMLLSQENVKSVVPDNNKLIH